MTQNFNPRLREGGDRGGRKITRSVFDFNPRLREGGDACTQFAHTYRLEISIHASEKEATTSASTQIPYIHDFNPRLREGGDQNQTRLPRRISIFQSTPPRRRRLQHIVIPQLSCTYLVSTTFLSAIFSFISQYIVLFFLF